jgi:hypothetical protein
MRRSEKVGGAGLATEEVAAETTLATKTTRRVECVRRALSVVRFVRPTREVCWRRGGWAGGGTTDVRELGGRGETRAMWTNDRRPQAPARRGAGDEDVGRRRRPYGFNDDGY